MLFLAIGKLHEDIFYLFVLTSSGDELVENTSVLFNLTCQFQKLLAIDFSAMLIFSQCLLANSCQMLALPQDALPAISRAVAPWFQDSQDRDGRRLPGTPRHNKKTRKLLCIGCTYPGQ